MKHYKKNIVILDLERKHNSVNGNPTWRIFANGEKVFDICDDDVQEYCAENGIAFNVSGRII